MMKKIVQMIPPAVVFSAIFLIFPQKAHAYIDPGTGSMIIQLLIAGILGATFTIKVYWKKIKAFWASRAARKSGEEGDAN